MSTRRIILLLLALGILLIGHASGQMTLDVDVPPGWDLLDSAEEEEWGYWDFGTYEFTSFVTIEYDTNRTTRIALVKYADGERRYILAPLGIKVGGSIISTDKEAEILPGNSLLLKNIPVGTTIHNIEYTIGKGGQIARTAGAAATLMAKEGKHALLKMPSGELRKVLLKCRATIGQLSNVEHSNIKNGKAGRTRWLGRRPHVRGTVMNPVDHPHGGGESEEDRRALGSRETGSSIGPRIRALAIAPRGDGCGPEAV